MKPRSNTMQLAEIPPAPGAAPQVLAELLSRDRDRFNARFAVAQSRWRGLRAREWKQVLADFIAPLAAATHEVLPARAQPVAEAAYDVALELLGRDLLGPRAASPAMAVLWRDILPLCAAPVASDPRRVLAHASNALLEARAHGLDDRWIARLHSLARSGALSGCGAEEFERALFVLAWRCGLAHARERALQVLPAVEPGLGRAILGAPAVGEASWSGLLEKMERNPFFHPSRSHEPSLRVVASVGDWEAWGGSMAAPPKVVRRRGRLWAWSGRAWWRLHADAFGATLTRARFSVPPEDLPPAMQADESGGNWRLQVRGESLQISHGPNAAHETGVEAEVPGFDGVLSAASDDHALAFTTRLSLRVFVVARG